MALSFVESRISIHTLRMEGDYDGMDDNMEFDPIISIHTLRMEGDSATLFQLSSNSDFNPHPPHGG